MKTLLLISYEWSQINNPSHNIIVTWSFSKGSVTHVSKLGTTRQVTHIRLDHFPRHRIYRMLDYERFQAKNAKRKVSKRTIPSEMFQTKTPRQPTQPAKRFRVRQIPVDSKRKISSERFQVKDPERKMPSDRFQANDPKRGLSHQSSEWNLSKFPSQSFPSERSQIGGPKRKIPSEYLKRHI